jgi:hypothetical protein
VHSDCDDDVDRATLIRYLQTSPQYISISLENMYILYTTASQTSKAV